LKDLFSYRPLNIEVQSTKYENKFKSRFFLSLVREEPGEDIININVKGI